ncbi:MAG: NDP-sugar synthase [Planctomycetota bacterium]
MRAIVMAGGKGTRLHPYTMALPKPLMPVGQWPILELMLRQLAHYGIKRVTITVNHMANLIMAFVGSGEGLGLEIDYAIEDEPRGTIGPLAHIKGLADDGPFLVMNGDLLTDLDFSAFNRAHRTSDAMITVATCTREVNVDLGVMEFDDDGRLVSFREKPVLPLTVSMGIYAMHPSALQHVPTDRPFGFDDLMKVALSKKLSVRPFSFQGLWLDIGRPEDYGNASELLDRYRRRFCPWEPSASEPRP